MSLSSNVLATAGTINPDQQLKILTKVSLPGVVSGNLTWSMVDVNDDSSSFDLSSLALTPLRQSVVAFPSLEFQIVIFNLVVPRYVLTGGMTYNFRLDSTVFNLGITTSLISITVNASPRVGSFAVDP